MVDGWWLSVARTEATDETDMTQAQAAWLQADEGENTARLQAGDS